MFYGLDVHKEFLQVCALGDDGRERKDFRVGGHPEAIEAFARGLDSSDQVVLEATFHTWAIVQILRRHVDRVVVADPAQLKAIASARIKTDKVDAHILAQLLRLDFLPEVELPTRETWGHRQLMAHRRQLRQQSIAAKNSIHAVLNRSLLRYPGKLLFTHARAARGHRPSTIEEVYAEAGIVLAPPSQGELRASKRSRRAITRARNETMEARLET